MKKKIAITSILKLIILYLCYTRIETNSLFKSVSNNKYENIIEKHVFNYQNKLLEKKLKLDITYKPTLLNNTNDKLKISVDIEGKWIGYTNQKVYKKNIDLRLVIKNNERLLNTTLFGMMTLY
jgi:hypothetical protein